MIRGYLKLLGSQRGQMYVFLAWAVVYAITQGLAMLMLVPIARGLLNGDLDYALRWLWWLIPVVAVCSISFYIQAMKSMHMAIFAMRTLHHRLGEHMVRLPLGWFTRDQVGRVSQIAVKGTMFVGTIGAHLLSPIVTNAIASVTVVIGMLFLDWRVGLVTLVGAIFLVLVGKSSSRMVAAAERQNHPAAVEVNNQVLEFARYQPVLRAFGQRGSSYRPLDDALTRQYVTARKNMMRSVAGISANGLAVQAVFTGILVAAAWFATHDGHNPALLLAIAGLAARFTGPISELAVMGSALRMANDEIMRITGILDTQPVSEPETSAHRDQAGRVELSDVSFGYGGRRVLDGVSMVAEPGTMTALVGPSGSGKTTITRLIARFYDVDSGVVRVGGADVRDQRTEDLMGQLSLVFQDVYLFDDTLWENIRIGDLDATDDDIRQAADTAGVTAIADRLPQSWDTPVGEAGTALSGGERQRVSIARALLKKAPIVLFDEATSALDPENEIHVAASIRQLARSATVIVIAHKLSTITAADQIIMLTSTGTVGEVGTHDELLAAGGGYAGFWERRNAASGWSIAV